MTTLTAREVEEIKKRLAKATPGPWSVKLAFESDKPDVDPMTYESPGYYNNIGIYSEAGNSWPCACDEYDVFESRQDVVFIAAAPTDIARLLETVEAQQAEIESLKAQKADIVDRSIELLSNSVCEKHVESMKGISFNDFCRHIEGKCSYCGIEAMAIKEPDPKTGQVS